MEKPKYFTKENKSLKKYSNRVNFENITITEPTVELKIRNSEN